MRIQHNIMAMNAYRNYNTNTSALSKNLEKLSSGYKINRAGDDAAGLAISEKMRAQITGLNAAQKNVKDGISLVKTAEGAMQEIQDMLNRMDYLATQSANGTYDNEVDRANLQKEVDALRTEIDRIADSANFNGINLLDGTQAGVKASAAWTETVDPVDVKGMDRILTTLLGKNEKPYDANNTKTVLDSYAPAATKASFEIDLSKLSFSAYDVKATSGTISGASLGNVTLTVGGQDIVIKGSQLTAGSITITSGSAGSITGLTGTIWANAAVSSIRGTKSTAEVTIGGVDWTVTESSGKLKFTQKSTPKTEAEGKADFSVNVSYTDKTGSKASIKLTGDVNPGTENTKLGIPDDAARRASTVFKMEKSDIVDGATLQLGSTTYSLKVGKDGKGGSGTVIDLTSLGDDFTLDQALTKIANTVQSFTTSDSVTFKVGVSNDSAHPGITVIRQSNPTSAADAQKYDTLEELASVFSLKHGGGTIEHDAVTASGGLTLQIGDTSDSFNQMTVNIGDMHVDAMGFDLDKKGNITKDGKSISEIDISSQQGAKDAIDTIKNAINYVSSIRGDLGAIQNRLEHTANNLSVMAENIQDAESTIRDTDVAEEMMAYTKNNILVQSAQAMLAQANAVPQGVLQLLG